MCGKVKTRTSDTEGFGTPTLLTGGCLPQPLLLGQILLYTSGSRHYSLPRAYLPFVIG